ncbi:FimD/PapC N-terminal domain-containing protein [Klebsiella pneumoniae subsp. pneumoniae]|nr:FimD/PapC N-terminal domain-containing protein [Klebsiella pneumoniae subsp. pneumoniae]
MSWQVNGVTLDARKTVTFRQNDRGQLTPCLKPEDLLQAGVNPAGCPETTGATSRSCPELNALLPGSTVNFDFAHQRLVMTIPQALMTHRARDNVPLLCGTKVLAPSRVTIVIQAPASVPARAATRAR